MENEENQKNDAPPHLKRCGLNGARFLDARELPHSLECGFQDSRHKKERKMKGHFKIIAVQIVFLVMVFLIIFLIYPKANVSIHGNFVKFSSENADVIMVSESPDFSDSKYLDLKEIKNASLDFKPGKYYWKPYNELVEGFAREFVIESEVGMKIDRAENESGLVNIGNVKINVTRTKAGVMVGRIILEPEQSEKIEDEGEYIGRQA